MRSSQRTTLSNILPPAAVKLSQFAKLNPRPVFTTTPTIIPAHAVAMLLPLMLYVLHPLMHLIYLLNSYSRIFINSSQLLYTLLYRIMQSESTGTPTNINTIIKKIGKIKYSFLNISLRSGICSSVNPRSPNTFCFKVSHNPNSCKI